MAASSERQRVRTLIRNARVAMFITIDERAAPTGRPMRPLFLADDPYIYFLTHLHSRKVKQIIAQPQVSMAMSLTGGYFMLTGTAMVLQDDALIRRLWHPTYRAWFPKGKSDREAIALRVNVGRVDYWEPPRSGVIRVVQAVKAIATRRTVESTMKTITGL